MSRTLLLAACLAAGCHAKFKKAAPTLDAVHPQVVSVAQAPTIALGGSGNVILDTVNQVRAADVAEKLSKQVHLPQVNDAFRAGLAETLGDGPPFGLTDAKDTHTLQIEVVDYGLVVPEMGGAGWFAYKVRARIYRKNGERVYSTSLGCETPVMGADPISEVLNTRDNVGNVLDMRKKEVQAAFDGAASECGRELALKMRKHAG